MEKCMYSIFPLSWDQKDYDLYWQVRLSMLYVLAREFDTRFMEHGPSFLSPYIQDRGHSYGFKDWIHLAIWLHVLVNQSGF